MKAVMMSIQPKWCELIANGKKTIEVRKTRPKLETPFKSYIYCTKPKEKLIDVIKSGDLLYGEPYEGKTVFLTVNDMPINMSGRTQKVIGEFMCYDIGEYETEFYPKGKKQFYEAIYQYNEEEEVWEPVLTNDAEQETQFAKDTCLSFEDFRNYLGAGENRFYGLCISDVVIYDKPKELSEFTKTGALSYEDWLYALYNGNSESSYEKYLMPFKVTKPPQSWCYVEELV